VQVNFIGKVLALVVMVSPLAKADEFETVGSRFHIDPLLLKAIARKESGLYNQAINNKNTNHTIDVCMMGINSSHFKELGRFGISRTRLLNEPKVCVAAGAWILNGFFEKYGRSWNTVGMYNTGASAKLKGRRNDYAASVKDIYNQLAKQMGTQSDPFAG